mmetsp:Transcript_4897/g.6932  ORF Transcript_4897/g.6932 Transcript_4897/m.6932 type:complete len:119 (+) Transcript_4897:103-459(+)
MLFWGRVHDNALLNIESYVRDCYLDSAELKKVAQKLSELADEANARSLLQTRSYLFQIYQQLILYDFMMYVMNIVGLVENISVDSGKIKHRLFDNKTQERCHEIFGDSPEILDWLGLG